MTTEMIKREGSKPLDESTEEIAARILVVCPTYHLFENNCQNFATFLLKATCSGASVPDSIQSMIT